MVQAEDDNVVIDDVKRMAKFSRVPDSGHVFQVNPMLAEKSHQLRSRLVSEPEDHPLIELPGGRVSGYSSKNWEAAAGELLNRRQVAVFEVRPDSCARGREVREVPLHVAFYPERQVHKSSSAGHSFWQSR